ncbi:MAG: DUF262 domain-containing protein [Prevotella sp.]|nr:DUF262 domain-containing protein [Prevotella sp.]
MAEVRFKIKGKDNEVVFTPIKGGDGNVYLYSKLDNGEEKKILLKENSESRVFQLAEDSIFDERPEVIEERLLGLSGEWLEEQSQGFEAETKEENQSQPGYGPDDIFVENKPFSLKQINDLIEEEDIELSPDFQRNFIWDETRQSRLIESIFLGLPLPSIYLSQYKDGRLTIVDGLQRIMTIRRFLNNELKLSNLEYLSECNGKNYDQLKDYYSPLRMRRFGQTQIMCFVIDYRSPNKLKFDLFRRLNTGGKPLNNQEIRNCLSRPELRTVLKEMVNTTAFKNATGRSVKDTRMEAQETALRFLYFYTNYNEKAESVSFYNGNMEDTLDNAVEFFNNYAGLKGILPVYEQAMKDAYRLFGEHTFRKVYKGQTRRSQVNKLLMLSLSVLLAKHSYQYREKLDNGIKLTDSLRELIDTDENLFNALTWSTNSKWNVEYVFRTLKRELLDKNLL